MGMLSKLVKAGVAKKVIDEARKPENQARIKKGVEHARVYASKRKGSRS